MDDINPDSPEEVRRILTHLSAEVFPYFEKLNSEEKGIMLDRYSEFVKEYSSQNPSRNTLIDFHRSNLEFSGKLPPDNGSKIVMGIDGACAYAALDIDEFYRRKMKEERFIA